MIKLLWLIYSVKII